ncbi:hypothetical protein [Streptomyces sp. NPDC059122]|uniref:hypothetical protein n=1 Tax=unclassified Streptomyces TaxID=2593676 RepID=UPI0036CE613A
MLLTTLLHILGCAHGPTAAPALRADLPSYASSATGDRLVADGHRGTAPGRGAPAPDRETHCCALDQPTVQASREDDLAASALVAAVPSGSAGLHPGIPPSAPHPARAWSTTVPGGATRALLGVWRN